MTLYASGDAVFEARGHPVHGGAVRVMTPDPPTNNQPPLLPASPHHRCNTCRKFVCIQATGTWASADDGAGLALQFAKLEVAGSSADVKASATSEPAAESAAEVSGRNGTVQFNRPGSLPIFQMCACL